MFELEIKGGNVVKIYKRKDEKAMIEYKGVNYDLESMINLLEEKKGSHSSVSEEEIEQFEQDPRMKKMVEDSSKDLEQGKALSTKEVIAKIRRGEI